MGLWLPRILGEILWKAQAFHQGELSGHLSPWKTAPKRFFSHCKEEMVTVSQSLCHVINTNCSVLLPRERRTGKIIPKLSFSPNSQACLSLSWSGSPCSCLDKVLFSRLLFCPVCLVFTTQHKPLKGIKWAKKKIERRGSKKKRMKFQLSEKIHTLSNQPEGATVPSSLIPL